MKNLFNKIKEIILSVLGAKLNLFRKHGELAVMITENLKKAVESPVAGGIASIIPNDRGNILLAKAREIAPRVAFKVAIAHKILQANQTPEDVLLAVANKLKEEDSIVKSSFWIRFSAEVMIALSDGKISLSEAIILGQLLYNELFAKK
jgi:hypothetical protein